MIIREATNEDFDEVFSLDRLWTKKEWHPAFTSNNEKWFKKNINKGNVFVAVERGVVVGYASGGFYKSRKKPYYGLKKGETYFYLDSLYVKRDYRSKGVGKLLLRRVERYATKKGVRYVLLTALSKDIMRTASFYVDNNYKPENIQFFKELKAKA